MSAALTRGAVDSNSFDVVFLPTILTDVHVVILTQGEMLDQVRRAAFAVLVPRFLLHVTSLPYLLHQLRLVQLEAS